MTLEKSDNPDKEPDLCKEAAWKTADPFVYRLLKEERKEMRDHMTQAEELLWAKLKSNKLGVKFRRQHMILGFIADFVALSCQLIIEVDGRIHDQQKEYDENRSFLLRERGFRVIRFTNDEIIHNIDSAIQRIKELLNVPDPSRLSDPTLPITIGPPPSGEEW